LAPVPHAVYLYRTPAGKEIVRDEFAFIQGRERPAWTPISIGIRMLTEYGADTTLGKFKRLRHIGSDAALWELRAQGRPAYRVLFSSVPGADAFVILLVVRKDDMAREPMKYINTALERYAEWIEEVWKWQS
jgi:hypothetical protein